MATQKTVLGMRLKLIRGDDETISPKDVPTYSHGVWIAGLIPVGTVGTVYEHATDTLRGRRMFALDFGITPKDGYVFGLEDMFDDARLEILNG